jgi:ectoine hydroxylase-related dioxygenase (phytanoyl-CoA dioxygenase family)
MTHSMPEAIDDEHVRRFEEDGYFVLERALDEGTLAMLRREADLAVESEAARLARGESGIEQLTHRERYFVIYRSRTQVELRSFLFSRLMGDVCARLIGPDAYLFTELFVCKLTGPETSFGWHQDFGYVDHFGFGHHSPNVSVWTALDDMSDENGTLRVLPFSRGGTRHAVKHRPAPTGSDIIADFGEGEGEVLDVPAGSIVVMSGLLPHRSGPNTTPRPRRAYLFQYSKRPVLIEGHGPAQMAVPVLAGGVLQAPDYSTLPARGPSR